MWISTSKYVRSEKNQYKAYIFRLLRFFLHSNNLDIWVQPVDKGYQLVANVCTSRYGIQAISCNTLVSGVWLIELHNLPFK